MMIKAIKNLDFKGLSNSLLLFASCFLAFGINLPSAFIPRVVFFFLMILLIYVILNFSLNFTFTKDNLPLFFLIVFFVWLIFTIIYSQNKLQAYKLLEIRTFLIIFPFLLIIAKKPSLNKNAIALSFVLGNIISIIICFILIIKNRAFAINIIHSSSFLASIINSYKHYNYLGLNLSICLLFINFLFRERTFKIRLFIVFMCTFFFLYLILISGSHLSIILLCLSFTTIVFSWIKTSKTIRYSLALMAVGGIIFLFVFLINTKTLLDYKLIKSIDKERTEIWSNSWELIQKQPIFGYGIGDSNLTFENLKNGTINSHNQYFDILLESGSIGLIIFLGFWAILFFIKLPPPIKIVSVGFTLVFFIAMFFESILNRISGVSLLGFVVYFMSISENQENNRFDDKGVFVLKVLILFLFCASSVSLFLNLKNSKFNPLYPITYTSGPNYSIKYNLLPGTVPKELPNKSLGYLVDKNAYFESWDNNLYFYTNLGSLKKDDLYSYTVSVFCYVSEDFNGNWVRLNNSGESIDNSASYYDLNRKCTWQRLVINPLLRKGNTQIYLFFSKKDITKSDSLKGFVIFVYPEIK
jgi:O-antigen ligase